MLTATAAAAGIRPLAAEATGSGTAGWWDVASGLLLAAAGAWATWAQFIYPKIAERKARAAAANNTPAPAGTPTAPPVDLVGEFYRDQSQRLDDVLEALDNAHRKHARDAGTIARLTAERDEARRQTCTHHHPERIDT